MNELQEAAVAVRNQIASYERGTLGYRIFEPIDQDHPLHQAVQQLKELHQSGQLPSPGRGLWRSLIQSANLPSQDDFLKVFKDLEVFEAWLEETFFLDNKLTQDNSMQQLRSAPNRTLLPNPVTLTDTERDILEAIGSTPKRSHQIADDAGYSKDAVRRHLSSMKKRGFILNDGLGYYRSAHGV